MFIKSTIVAFATVAALGTTMLTTSITPVEAGIGNRSGPARMGNIGNRGGHMKIGSPHKGPGMGRHVGGRHGIAKHHFRRHGIFVHRPRHKVWLGYARVRPVWYAARPIVYGTVGTYGVVSTNHCTCLTKEYTVHGAVLFKDVCTNEAAVNPAPSVKTGSAPASSQSN